LTVARITEKKGLPTVYHALRQLLDRGMDFEHVLIGDGDDRLKILELIQELGLNDRCRWVGSTTHNQVLEEFTRSDLFILGCEIAKDGDRDGVPNVLVESLAMGIPAVATNVSAIPEILVDGETGLTVNQKDSTALADAIIELLTNQELRKKVIAGGRSLVNERYDNSRLITKLAELFAEANPQLAGVKKTDEQTS
jgi:glycosyltransferase involved in cell wall biosynthesis